MRHTSRAIVIKDKKILLLTGYGAGYFWTPGGGIEDGETPIETVHREVQEELGVNITNLSLYLSYDYNDQKVTSYLVDIDGGIRVGNEITHYVWFSPGDRINLSKGFEAILLPKLVDDDLL